LLTGLNKGLLSSFETTRIRHWLHINYQQDTTSGENNLFFPKQLFSP